jgi:adenine-specific DNA-methyltransferase
MIFIQVVHKNMVSGQREKLIHFVEQMLVLHKNLSLAQTPQEKERLKRQVEATNHAIDLLVYALYGLNDDEIRIIDDGLSKT